MNPIALAIHGGCGVMSPEGLPEAEWAEARAALTAALHDDYLAAPELTELETGTPSPPPSLMFGETGILLAVEAMAPTAQPRRLDALHAVIAGNARNPARELCWGSPRTLLALGRCGATPGRRAGVSSGARARRGCGTSGGSGSGSRSSTGRPAATSAPGTASRASPRCCSTAPSCSVTGGRRRSPGSSRPRPGSPSVDGCAQWPGLADEVIARRPVQWCHGAPGIITSLAVLPATPEIDALLDGRTPEPPIAEATMCTAGQTYLSTLAELPPDVRSRRYGLAVDLMAKS